MKTCIAFIGVSIIFIVLFDAFEVIVLPRRVTRRFRLTRFFYRSTWKPWSAIARRMWSQKLRETYLSFFGPLSLLMLLTIWALSLIVGFALLQWALGSPLRAPDERLNFGVYLYMSGTTFFTLGFGDVTPVESIGRALATMEAGVGFGFLALIMGYLPVIYQGFSRREVNISLLDARAGSPPSAAELLRRHGQNLDDLGRLLQDWERWAAELMESHLSYPVLCYFRSQHNNQSWLMALTTILDASAIMIAGIDGVLTRQARLTFAMACHAVVDLAQIFNTPPRAPAHERLSPDDLLRLRVLLAASGLKLRDGMAVDEKISELRQMYEPYVNALADFLFINTSSWLPQAETLDNWQTSAWGRISTSIASPARLDPQEDEHF
jgi:hypothetical protein